jgi:hypothetical protein
MFAHIGQSIVQELRQRMFQQTGTDGARYGLLKPATIRQKQKISTATADQRMIRTKDFVNNAFESEPARDSVRLFVSDAPHGRELKSLTSTLRKYQGNPGKFGKRKIKAQAFKVAKQAAASPSYKEIAGWQLDTGEAVFFPQSREEILALSSVAQGIEQLQEEATRQAHEQFTISLQEEFALA